MWSIFIGISFSISMFSWIRLACMLKNAIDTTEISLILYYYIHSLIYFYLPRDKQITLTSVIKKTFSFYTAVFNICVWIHITKIYQIYIIQTKFRAKHFKPFVTTCFQIWSRIILSMFLGNVLSLYIFYSCICQLNTHFDDGKVLEYTVSWFHNEMNQLQTEYYPCT